VQYRRSSGELSLPTVTSIVRAGCHSAWGLSANLGGMCLISLKAEGL
jgi:hypothetical protein